MSHQQIQKYEKGENSISCARLAQLAEALGVTAASLLEGIDTPKPNQLSEPKVPPYEQDASYDQKTLTKAIENLPNASMRKAVVDFLKIVSDNTKRSA